MTREELLVRVMHALAEHCRASAILEGGMLLRLLNCPRATQDVDYVLLSDDSKKTLAPKLEKILASIDGVHVRAVRINSRGIFFDLETRDDPPTRAAVEITVQSRVRLASESASTAQIARQYALPGRIVRTMALAEAFANKIAAVLERDNVRDWYDLTQFEPLTPFDAGTLQARLATLEIARKKPRAYSGAEAAALLRAKLTRVTESTLAEGLYPLLPAGHRAGLLRLIHATAHRVIARVEALPVAPSKSRATTAKAAKK